MWLISVYCLLILLASLAGGWLPFLVRLTHTRIQVATSFVAGLMLGVGILHLLPQAWSLLRDGQRTVTWLLAGFLTMFLIQRFLHYHHHEVPTDAPASPRHGLSWAGAAGGLALHTLINGFALGASVAAEGSLGRASLPAGMGTFLAIVLHKPFDAMTIGLLMASGGRSKASRHIVNGLFALMVVLGVVLFYTGGAHLFEGSEFLGVALAFSAGTFLCIAASDLLPEIHFHRHDRLLLSAALLAGVGLAVLIESLEHAGHGH